jgi:hypothetical protein
MMRRRTARAGSLGEHLTRSYLEEARACYPRNPRMRSATVFQLGGHSGRVTSTKLPQAVGGFCRCRCSRIAWARSRRLKQDPASGERILGSRNVSRLWAASRSQPYGAPESLSLFNVGSTPATAAISTKSAVKSSYHSSRGRPSLPHSRLQLRGGKPAGVGHLRGVSSQRSNQ